MFGLISKASVLYASGDIYLNSVFCFEHHLAKATLTRYGVGGHESLKCAAVELCFHFSSSRRPENAMALTARERKFGYRPPQAPHTPATSSANGAATTAGSHSVASGVGFLATLVAQKFVIILFILDKEYLHEYQMEKS